MTQQSIDGAPKAELTAARTGDAGAGGREPWRRQHVVRTQVKRALERAAEAGAKAVVAVVEINPEYAGRAPQRLAAVLAQWRHRHRERFEATAQGRTRVALVIAPVAQAAQGRSLAEKFARALDPRVCPLLTRALPYAYCGVTLYPDDGADAVTLIQRAEEALREARAAGTHGRTVAAARRRHAAAQVLGPVAVRRAPIQP